MHSSETNPAKYCALRSAEKSFRNAKTIADLPPHIDLNKPAAEAAATGVEELAPPAPKRNERLRLFSFASPRGFFILKNFLSAQEQLLLAQTALNELARPPHRTNLYIYEEDYRRNPANAYSSAKPYDAQRFAVSDDDRFHFNTKVRWANVGEQYDWDNRRYFPRGATEIPARLRQWAVEAAAAAGLQFSPEALIVNYYGADDHMGAHLDDGEPDQQRPIVSFSLGLSCVFLLGGRRREDAPVALRLDSGDVCVMGGESRLCFHGVPRVCAQSYARAGAERGPPRDDGRNSAWHAENYLCAHRLNLNFRQVRP